MPLVFNGTTIPTNVANALMYNGVSVTQVIFNGTTVWQQSLGLSVGFSGSTICQGQGSVGLQTSGLNYRAAYGGYYGAWQSVNSQGIFSGNTTAVNWDGVYESNYHIGVSSNLIRQQMVDQTRWGAWVTLTASTKSFSGGEPVGNNWDIWQTFNTSSGLMRSELYYRWGTSGAWISIA